MQRIRELAKPRDEHLSLVKEAACAIKPEDPQLESWYGGYVEDHLERLAFDLGYLVDEYSQPARVRVLEVGCTPPILTRAMKAQGFEVVGVDVQPARFGSSLEEAGIRVERARLGLDALPFAERAFHVILMNEIFEHINGNLLFALSEVFRVLLPGGRLYVSTPNLRSLVGLRNYLFRGRAYSCCGDLYEEYAKLERYGHMGHVREYTVVEVSEFLSRIGFSIDGIIYRGRCPGRYRLLGGVFPQLRPFFSVLARRRS